MKYTVFIAILAIFISSCSVDDDSGAYTELEDTRSSCTSDCPPPQETDEDVETQ